MSRHVTFMTIDDAGHYTPEQRAAIIAAYPEHEREARAKGIPVLGSGRIFPVPEEMISCEPFRLPRWWPRIGALDFGWDHPSAAVELAWDTEADVVYVTKAHRAAQQTPAMQALALKAWGEWLPFAWPRDGRRETLEGAGVALAKQYAAHGLNMLTSHARFADGSVSVEAGLMEMLDRMQSGRFKVFSALHAWFEEFRLPALLLGCRPWRRAPRRHRLRRLRLRGEQRAGQGGEIPASGARRCAGRQNRPGHARRGQGETRRRCHRCALRCAARLPPAAANLADLRQRLERARGFGAPASAADVGNTANASWILANDAGIPGRGANSCDACRGRDTTARHAAGKVSVIRPCRHLRLDRSGARLGRRVGRASSLQSLRSVLPMIAVIIRIGLRYGAGVLVARGLLGAGDAAALSADPDIQVALETGIGLALSFAAEAWYAFARRFHWSK